MLIYPNHNVLAKICRGVVAILAGAILPLAFAPFGYYWMAEISLVLLLLTWFNASPRAAFYFGWLYGVAFFSCGAYWVYISIHDFGHAPVILAVLIQALLVGFLALYPALQGYFLNRFFKKNSGLRLLVAFPVSWVILEWIRGWLLSGFPWLYLGYGHIDSLLSGWATIFGVYGVSFAVALTAGLTFYLFCKYRDTKREVAAGFSLRKQDKKHLSIVMLFFIVLWGGGTYLSKIEWSQTSQGPIDVSLIQANIPQEKKWQTDQLRPTLNSYTLLTAKNKHSKIIVWPETAIPTFPENVALSLKSLSKAAKKRGTTILTGVPFYDGADDLYYNGIMAFGASAGKYYKRQLVPFGEYLPLKPLLRWLNNFVFIPMSDFSSGADNQPELYAGKILLAPFICYEIAYASLVLDYLPRAQLLVTVCDDSWFGDSIAAAQHLEVARMRSLEVGRYQLLSSNTGISAVIDAQGKIIGQAPVFQEAVLNSEVFAMDGATPWVKFGRYLWLPLCLLGLWFARRK